MKLSEAMLKGIEGTPQARRGFVDRPTGGRCALTCVIYGAGLIEGEWPENGMGVLRNMLQAYPILDKSCANPIDNNPSRTKLLGASDALWGVICELNLNWTREEIATWLESIGE